MEPDSRKTSLQSLPAVDELLHHPRIQAHFQAHSREVIVASIRRVLARKREAILAGTSGGRDGFSREEILAGVEEELAHARRPSLQPVINATGVVLHTNLGRAPLSGAALRNILEVARGYSNLEFDLQTGERGSRYAHVEEMLCRLTGAESALVVNNNAGAVLLALNSMADGKEVVVSRGQLVEIGGSFRMPDVMRKSGARLVEVGTTNRTYPEDYEKAIGEQTALLLRVHMSNFRIVGFTAEVPLKELAELGRRRGIPVMEDLGSGSFVDFTPYGMEKEPTVQEAVTAGADLVTFSGDKLLGGPQAGIILGRKEYVGRLKKNPLTRALRIDKLTLAGLETILREYLDPARAVENIPALRMLACPAEELRARAERLEAKLSRDFSSVCRTRVRPENSQVGGGALPLQVLPTFVVGISPLQISAAVLEERLRNSVPPVIARIKEEEILLDLRTVAEGEESELLRIVAQALNTE